jgi:hypothetical protein
MMDGFHPLGFVALWPLVLGLAASAEESPPPAGAVVLFDGRTLDAWSAEGTTAHPDGHPVWSVKDGLIHCDGKGFGFLRYKKAEFSDFRWHVEFRLQPKCNSGVGFRTRIFDPEQSNPTRPSYFSYEIQFIDDAGQSPTKNSSGSLYRYLAPRANAMKPAGQWNTLEVTAVGPHLTVVLNGETIQDVDQSTIEALKSKPLMGSVCVQNHGGTVDFRNLWVERLTGEPASHVSPSGS